MEKLEKILDDCKEMILDYLDDNPSCYGGDMHHEIFNTDYFIIGRNAAKNYLEANIGVFEAIEIIKEYEQTNFGEVIANFSEPERVCNMLIYIAGGKVLYQSETLTDDCWNRLATEEDIKNIRNEIEEISELDFD